MVSFMAMDTKPSVLTVTSPAMPKSTMLSPSSGSMTARNSSVTSSAVGGATWGLDMVKTYREASNFVALRSLPWMQSQVAFGP
jgi:hypothetical protein